jgi:tetratricopeptide (TPR) repeat protein
MIQLLFSLRFRPQIRKTNPLVCAELEKKINAAIREGGGTVSFEHKITVAEFDEKKIACYLNILDVLEAVRAALKEAAPSLYGHTCLVREVTDAACDERIMRKIPFTEGSGLWCSPEIEKKLSPFIVFKRRFLRDSDTEWAEFESIKNSAREEYKLDRSLGEIVYACVLLNRYFPSSAFLELFAEQGVNPSMVKRGFSILADKDILHSAEDPSLRVNFSDEDIEKLLDKRAVVVRELATASILSWIEKGKLKPCYKLLEALHDLGGGIDDKLALDALRADIARDDYDGIETALRTGRFREVLDAPGGGMETPEEPKRSAALRYVFKTLKALTTGSEEEISAAFCSETADTAFYGAYRALIITLRALYCLAGGDIDTAMKKAKEALLLSQSTGEQTCRSLVYRLISLAHFSQRRLNDAIDYIPFAIENAKKTQDNNELAVAAYYAAVEHFTYGNIAAALRFLDEPHAAAEASGRTEWAERARFFSGRLYFEIGRYEEAAGLFASLLEHGARAAQKRGTLRAWVYRAAVYRAQAVETPPLPADLDAPDESGASDETANADYLFFKIEAAFFAGDYQKTILLAKQLLGSLPEEQFLFLEQPDWSSGFAQNELLLVDRKSFFSNLAHGFSALSLVSLDKNNKDEAVRIMRPLIRNDRFPDTAPNDVLFNYLYYRIQCLSESGEVDKNTAISTAFKRLQRRASRIDSLEIKRAFLARQYWNSALFQAAKEHKLIQ